MSKLQNTTEIKKSSTLNTYTHEYIQELATQAVYISQIISSATIM